jgi:AraC-like DNA-binding protein
MKDILFNGHDIVLFFIIYMCLLFAVITLLARRDAGWTHLWLGLFLLSQAGLSAYILALYGDGFHPWVLANMPIIFELLEASFWLEGPLLLLYIRSALYQQFKFIQGDILLLLPLLIYMLTVLVVHIQFDGQSQVKFLSFISSNNIQYYEHLRNLVRIGFGVWAFLVIQEYQRKMPDAYSTLDTLIYNWLKLLVVGFIVLRFWSAFYLLLFTLVQNLFGEAAIGAINFDLMGIMSNYGQLLLISVLFYFGLADSRHIIRINKETLNDIGKVNNRPNYTEDQVSRVKLYMEKQRPYLDSMLKIDDLALRVSLSPKLLSTLINRQFEVNFFEYINGYRLKEVKSYLADPEMSDLSAIELALRAGYNSKSSFNRLFKLETGITPSQYRKEATEL